jgi:hypothetical protein
VWPEGLYAAEKVRCFGNTSWYRNVLNNSKEDFDSVKTREHAFVYRGKRNVSTD